MRSQVKPLWPINHLVWIPTASCKEYMGEGSRTFKEVICEIMESELPVVRRSFWEDLCYAKPSPVSPVITLEKLKQKSNWKYYYYWINRVISSKCLLNGFPRNCLILSPCMRMIRSNPYPKIANFFLLMLNYFQINPRQALIWIYLTYYCFYHVLCNVLNV